MRIAILDDYQYVVETLDCFSLLRGHKVQVLHSHYFTSSALAEQLDTPDALVLNRTRTAVTEDLLMRLPTLKIISQTGKNAGHIDVEACTTYGVVVTEGKGSPISTAELTWILIMNSLRKIPQSINSMKQGQWQTEIGDAVYQKRVGIWGYGRIGRRVARYAKAFDAQVVVWGSERSRLQAIADGLEAADTKEFFFSSCDVVSLHLRSHPSTVGIVKKEDLLRMKKNALLVNTARESLIEKNALIEVLEEKRPIFVAVDVYESEPIFDRDHPLLKNERVLCTPHLGYVERHSYELYFRMAFENILAFDHQRPRHVLNPEVLL